MKTARLYAKRQPQGSAWSVDRTRLRGLRRAIVFDERKPREAVEGQAVTYGAQVAFTPRPEAKGRLHGTGSTSDITIPGWTDTTGEAYAVLVQRRSNTNSNQWIEMGAAGNQDHFPFSSLVYTDAFMGSRWINGVALPSGIAFTDFMTVVLTCKNGNQQAYINGVSWTGNALGTGFNVPSSLVINSEFDGHIFACYLGEQFLTAAEAKAISRDPWRIWYQDRPTYAAEVAAPSGRIMSSLVHHGGLAGMGGLAGIGGGLAG